MRWPALSILVVRPAYQRKNIGSKLLRWGIVEAERANLPLFLESSDQGYQLYAKSGFKKLSDLGITLEDCGVVDLKEITLMIRPPNSNIGDGANKWLELLQTAPGSLPSV